MRAFAFALVLCGCGAPGPSLGGADAATGADLAGFVPGPHLDWPQLPGGPMGTLAPMRLVTLVSAGDPQAAQLFAFGDALAGSAWWQALSTEYPLGAIRASLHVTLPALAGDQDDAAMQDLVGQAISDGKAPAADGKTLYLVYLPPGSHAILGGITNTDCASYAGYHHRYLQAGDQFGLVQRCSNSNEPELAHLTAIGSHEIAEAATDAGGGGYSLGPAPGVTPWRDAIWRSYDESGDIEAGDLCEGTRLVEGGFSYQRILGNHAARSGGDPCVPSREPFFAIGPPAGGAWYAVGAGGTIDVPFAGWSTVPVDDWSFGTLVRRAPSQGWSWQTTSPTHETASPKMRPTTNNRRAATITVTAPMAPAGSFQIFQVRSYREAPDGNPPIDPGRDIYHFALFGVYLR